MGRRVSRCARLKTLLEPLGAGLANETVRQDGYRVTAGQRAAHIVSDLDFGRMIPVSSDRRRASLVSAGFQWAAPDVA